MVLIVTGLKNVVCNVPVKDTSLVHVIHCLDELIHVPPNPFLCHIMTATAYELIDVHVHELKHQRQPPCRLVTANSTLFRLFLGACVWDANGQRSCYNTLWCATYYRTSKSLIMLG